MTAATQSHLTFLAWQAGARALARELLSPPIELALTEAALALVRRCQPAYPAEPPSPRPAAGGGSRSSPTSGEHAREDPGSAPTAAADPAPTDVVPAAVLAFLRRKARA